MLRALKVLHIMQTERSLALTEEGDLRGGVEGAVRAPGAYTHKAWEEERRAALHSDA